MPRLSLPLPQLRITDRQLVWDLGAWAIRGLAKCRKHATQSSTWKNEDVPVEVERIPLLVQLHAHFEAELAKGASKKSIETAISLLSYLYEFSDRNHLNPAEDTVTEILRRYIASKRSVKAGRKISATSLYSYAIGIASPIAKVLERNAANIVSAARVKAPKKPPYKSPSNVADVTAFCAMLESISRQLTCEKLATPLPYMLEFDTTELAIWCGMHPPEDVKELAPRAATWTQRIRAKKREELARDLTYRFRDYAVFLRVEAELLMFISVTSMNLSQATALRYSKFGFASHAGGLTVRTYKARAGHDVEFHIPVEYRALFEQYTTWRGEVFGKEPGPLFPFTRDTDDVLSKLTFSRIRTVSLRLGIRMVGAIELRNCRVNWMARASNNLAVIADLAQHSPRTLMSKYLRPDHHVAAIETTTFWKAADPFQRAAGPGGCLDGRPQAIEHAPPNWPRPTCLLPSSCLFCRKHRDVDDFDYIWSLVTLRRLKIIELSKQRIDTGKAASPCATIIERITHKMSMFLSMGPPHDEWCKEATDRIDEEDFHPHWATFIVVAQLL